MAAVVEKYKKSKKKRKNNEIEDDDKKNDDTNNNKESKLTNEYPAPPPIPLKDQVTILLFYAYCSKPMTNHQVNEAINYCKLKLNENDCTGRLRVAKEGFNATLTGSKDGIRAFTSSLANLDYNTFGDNKIDFKYVDGLPPNQKLKGLKLKLLKRQCTIDLCVEKCPFPFSFTSKKLPN